MKSSDYNIFFPNEDKIIGYNSLSDNFVILEPLLHQLFEASIHENAIEELQNVHESLYDVLVEKQFVINDNVNELELIKETSHEVDFDDSHYKLIVNPTMNCNFKCWYCYETHIKDSKMDEDTLMNITKFVDNLLLEKKDTLKTFDLQWFGGEPLLYFKKTILPLLKNIYPKMVEHNIDFTSGFTTNGLLINQSVLDDCKTYGAHSFQITLDGHRERHNIVRYISSKKGSYDEIVANIKLALRNELNVMVRINISAETIADLLKIIDDFKDLTMENKKYLVFSFHEVWQEEKNLTADISSIVDQFRLNNLRCNYIGENNATFTESCYADRKNHSTINYNGDVFKCTARDFEGSSREGVLDETGTIHWNEKFQKRIYDTRFSNKPCLECKILPICNGGCSQHRVENEGRDYCIHGFDENSKLHLVKEKFFSRMAARAPTNHFNDAVNQFLEFNFEEFKKFNEEIFQETLFDFFAEEIQPKNLQRIGEINDTYANLIKLLRENKIDEYSKKRNEIKEAIHSLDLNDREKKAASLFELPVTAYYHYKNKDYAKSLSLTNESILSDDFFLDKHPFLYGHKIQQLHNSVRILFKNNLMEDACILNEDILNHLGSGRPIKHNIGRWYPDYDIKKDTKMSLMVYQIFTETVGIITSSSKSDEQEKELFDLAFRNLTNINQSDLLEEIRPLWEFLDLKFSLLDGNGFDEQRVNNWVKNVKELSYLVFAQPLFFSLFASLGINSFQDNKAEYQRVYA